MLALAVDQILLQDTNGPMSFLQFEAMGCAHLVPRTVAYVDHSILQVDSRNSDDHRYLESVSARYGAIVSKAGNGICHQVHLETFSVPGESLVGTDSHTVMCGAVGMLALGAGSIQVAVAMGTGIYRMRMPEIVRVRLVGSLAPWVTAKDVILELLRRFSVKGGGGKIFEFAGPGVSELSVPQRATIANMGAEVGLTATVFPSDDITRDYFESMGRADDWRPVIADADADYDDTIEFNLSEVGMLVALPQSPDRVVPIQEAVGTKIAQVIIGSCTNGSWDDMYTVARMLAGKRVHDSVSVIVFPGSRRIMEAMAREGLISELLAAGAQIAAPGCGACPGLSHVPASGTKSLRTFNRNFPGRSGNRDDQVYLCSPVVAAASALTGVIQDPRALEIERPDHSRPVSFLSSTSGLTINTVDATSARLPVLRGPNIKSVPLGRPISHELLLEVVLKVDDNISTDDISPVGVQSLLLRTNIPAIAQHSFKYLDPTFVSRAKACANSMIVAGEHYGQGSSREPAASALAVLGVRVILAKSFARIHRANLVNWGIVPLQFEHPQDCDELRQGDELAFNDIHAQIRHGSRVVGDNKRTGVSIAAHCVLDAHERDVLLVGGVLAHARTSTPRARDRSR